MTLSLLLDPLYILLLCYSLCLVAASGVPPLPSMTTFPTILPNIYLLSQFDQRIEDDKISYELIEYPNKKITPSKNL